MMFFTEKYVPKSAAEFLGQKSSVEKIELFLKNRPSKALLIHGSTGVGKTTAVKYVAEKLGYIITEITPEHLNEPAMLNSIIKTTTLFGAKKLILIDNIESFYPSRGSIASLMKIVKESIFPIIFVALDVWDQRLKYLRIGCDTVQFKKPANVQVQELLQKILAAEKIRVEPGVTEFIAKNASGDIGAALQDLWLLCSDKKEIKKEDLAILEQRPKEENIFSAVQKIFKTTDIVEASKTFENLDVDLSLLMLWLAENVNSEYQSREEIADAYNFLSRSDVFLGRIIRQQHWGFFYYAAFLSTAGVAVSKKSPSRRFVKYTSPMKLNRLSQTKALRTITKQIATKVAGVTHTSSVTASRFYMPMLKILFKSQPDFKKNFTEKLELDKEEVSYLSS